MKKCEDLIAVLAKEKDVFYTRDCDRVAELIEVVKLLQQQIDILREANVK